MAGLVMTDTAIQAFEKKAAKQLEWARADLRASQDFTYEGLLELHAKTFTDDGRNSKEVSEYFAAYGKVRKQTPLSHGLHYKLREIKEGSENYLSVYSNMGKKDIARVRDKIQSSRSDKLTGLNHYEKTARFVELYQELDYLHSFADGNSRVNRVFVGEMAHAAGVRIEWDRIDRDRMYIARDKSLAEYALKHCNFEAAPSGRDYKQYVQNDLDKLNKRYPNVTLAKEIRTVSTQADTVRQTQRQSQRQKPKNHL